MKRFHDEIAVMARRKRAAAGFGAERFLTNGRVRKRSPFASCAPSEHCVLCASERIEHRQQIKRQRAQGRVQVLEQLCGHSPV